MDASYGGSFRNPYEDGLENEFSDPDSLVSERRLHVRAFDYWQSLRKGRPCPSIHELEPDKIAAFGTNSVLLDFSRSAANPGVTFIGRALREECGVLYGIRSVADVPERSLLSRLTEACGQILERKSPLKLEDSFLNHKDETISFRGILMPLSSDGQTIDFVYGVINWKAETGAVEEAPAEAPASVAAEAAEIVASVEPPAPEPAAGELTDWLASARARVERALKAANDARAALHVALGLCYAFSLLTDKRTEEFSALLAKQGLTFQPRSPMLSVVKLVFGGGFDRTRLSHYAAVLGHAHHLGLGCDDVPAWLDGFEGGIAGVVKAERARRAPAIKPDPAGRARAKMRDAAFDATLEFDAGDDEFVLLLARRLEKNRLGVLAALTEKTLVDRALKKSAR